jgi:hypothetical protein
MSASEAPALDAIAFQLAAALEKYEGRVNDMVDGWLDMELYREVSGQIEEIRRYSAALPQLSVHWVELLIAHAELVHSLWRLRFRESDADLGKLQEVRERHAACITSLRTRCLRMLSRTDPPQRPITG